MKLTQTWVGVDFDPRRINPIVNKWPSEAKGSGGLWTCSGNEWWDWMTEETSWIKDDTKMYRLTIEVDEDRKIVIETYGDLERLIQVFGYASTHSAMLSMSRYPDWEKVFQSYDVVEMTEKGQWATRLSLPYSLYGWDVASYYWNQPNIVEWEELAKVPT